MVNGSLDAAQAVGEVIGVGVLCFHVAQDADPRAGERGTVIHHEQGEKVGFPRVKVVGAVHDIDVGNEGQRTAEETRAADGRRVAESLGSADQHIAVHRGGLAGAADRDRGGVGRADVHDRGAAGAVEGQICSRTAGYRKGAEAENGSVPAAADRDGVLRARAGRGDGVDLNAVQGAGANAQGGNAHAVLGDGRGRAGRLGVSVKARVSASAGGAVGQGRRVGSESVHYFRAGAGRAVDREFGVNAVRGRGERAGDRRSVSGGNG